MPPTPTAASPRCARRWPPAECQHTEPVCSLRIEQAGVEQLGEHRRRGVDHVQPVPADAVDDGLGVAHVLGREQVHALSAEQAGQRLPARVETQGPGVRDAQCPAQPGDGREVHALLVISEVGRERPMGADDAFGFAGGTGREDDIGRGVGVDHRRCRPLLGIVGPQFGKYFGGQRQLRIRLSQNGFDPCFRQADIDRDVGRPGLQHGQDRDDRIQRAGSAIATRSSGPIPRPASADARRADSAASPA